MKFGTMHDRSPYRSWSITAVVRVFARYKLDLVGAGGYMGKRGTVRAGYYFFLRKRKPKSSIAKDFFLYIIE